MKTTRILLLTAATLLAACNQENMLENTDNDGTDRLVPMTFTAAIPQTRTELADGNNVHWTNGDRIAIWDGISESEFTATDINGSSATFTGQVTEGSQAYTAFYPYDLVTEMNSTSFTFNLPAEQTATAGTFANGLAPSWAQAMGGSTTLTFQNLCALVKFAVASDMAGEGTFTLVGATATEPLAGSLTYTIGTDGSDGTLSVVSDGAATRITLSGNFEAGQAYYFVVVPGTLEKGFSLLYENSEGKQYRRATSTGLTLPAGRILNLGEQMLNSFESALTNSAIINAVGDAINLDKQEDGTVSLTEENLKKMATVTELDLSGRELTSLFGIEYFTGLTTLDCSGNKLTPLSFGASSSLMTKAETAVGLTSLEELDCSNNQLTTLTLTDLPKLARLDCADNLLASVSLSNLPALYNLKLEYNQLTSIDVSTVPSVHYLGCYGNRLTSLDVSKLTQLEGLYCYENYLSSLDISMLSADLTLSCGNQKTVSGGTQTLTLYLNATQKAQWEGDPSDPDRPGWSSYPDNAHVIVTVK